MGRSYPAVHYRTILSDPSGQGWTSGISTRRPSQKLYIGERSGEADAELARRAIAKASTTIISFHMVWILR
jgi:hypothetical protein